MINMKIHNKNYHRITAFTLAEVLITLLIIGVVASIVVPNLLNDTRDAELKTAWRKTFSDFSQVTTRIAADNGGTLKGVFTSYDEIYNQLKNYMNMSKYCRFGNTFGNCWHYNGDYKYLNGEVPGWMNGAGYILNNNVLMYLSGRNTDCDGVQNSCLMFYIDTNGFKGPNTVGKDILGLYILENSVKPLGYPDDSSCNNTCRPGVSGWNGHGFSCSYEYLYQ